MSGSHGSIDYQLRPAKAVERKMMAEVFCRLSVFAPLDTYRYIGMGSVYFSDFALFHAACGFGSMISIEDTQDTRIRNRCKFNAPVALELLFKRTTAVFADMDWSPHSVVWLDYDDPLSRESLGDTEYCANRLRGGSILALSCNANRGKVRTRGELLARLANDIGVENTPNEANHDIPVDQEHYWRVLYAALSGSVQRGITARNAGKSDLEKYRARQVFFYVYDDSAPMLTVGWLLMAPEDEPTYSLANFPSIKHAHRGVKPFEIRIPRLTPAEMRAISRSDGTDRFEKEKSIPLLKEEIARFKNIERYWPMARFLELG